jgi:threonine dehydrogenase-like Zn-dependent dehydrogenase
VQAIVFQAGKLRVDQLPDPKPGAGELLVKVRLAGICGTDLEIVQGYGRFEGIVGHEFVGSVASGSTALAGKRVVGEINCVCGRCDMCAGGLSSHCRRRSVVGIAGRAGAFADYVVLPERNCIEVPATVGDEEAVFAEPLAAAYQVTRQVKIEPRMNVAVLGTGRLGLLVAQVLALRGCKLTAFGRNPKTLGLLDRKRIRTAVLGEHPGSQDYDVVVDCTGSPDGFRIGLGLVRPRGTIVLKTTRATQEAADLTPVVVNEITVLGSRCGPMSDALSALARKEIDVTSMITQVLPLSEGLKALRLAAEPDHIKVLLKVGQ